MDGGILQKISQELCPTVTDIPCNQEDSSDVPKRDNSRAPQNDLLAIQKGQQEQIALMQEMMQNYAHLKSDVDRLRKQMQEPCDESEDESSSMPTPDVADQASCSQPVTAAGIFEDIAAALSLSEAKGSPVSGPLASLTEKIIDKTMEDKKRNDLADKYPVPDNVTKLNPPKVNPEIWRIIEAKTRSKDGKLQKIQQFTLRAMVPIMQVIDCLVAGRDCQESLNFDELVTKLVDAVALTAVGNADANACRRESIKRDLNEEYQVICSNTNPVTQMLFGDNITDQLKSITESNKIGFKADTLRERPYFPEIRLFFRTTTVSTALSSNTEGKGMSSRRTAQGTVQCDSQTTCQTLASTCNVAEVSYSSINCIKLAGRLKHFGTQSEQLTTDKSILETVYACTIEFIDTPNQTHVRETKLNSKETIVLDREIKGLLLKGVIETTEHCDGEFISTVYLRPKSNGSYRVILNLKSLNESIEYIHFKMESLHAAIRLITPGCFMASIDLKDAYYTVNVSEEFRKYLRFIWRGQLYQYTCLANGLASAPRKFTKLLKPVFSCLRMKGFPSVVYLDDSYLQGTTYAECLENVSVTQELLADIVFVINNEKSVFIPTQELVFLGFILNSNTMTISLTEQKVQTITLAIQTLQNSAYYTIRQVAEIIGKMISYSIVIPYGILYTKVLEQDKTSALKYNKGNFDSHMTLSAESLIDLDW
ncbi:POL-like protein [Mya arenaria]|uniref:POL-like protein n=1 Tax=Mya arenaria TaxID=6604 RepID=A0ABY7EVL4_MYAAR|nr:POL-like protein [Mya arenaria]